MSKSCHTFGGACRTCICPQARYASWFLISLLAYHSPILQWSVCQLFFSQDRLDRIHAELCLWHGKQKCTKRELLSLIGKLMFISKVVRSGRTFVRRLIERSKCVRHLHHHIKLDRTTTDDILWWLHFLPRWNGISVFMDEHWTANTEI